MELDPQRLYSKVQRGYIYLSLGAYPEAITAFEASLEQSPRFGPACEGIANRTSRICKEPSALWRPRCCPRVAMQRAGIA